MDILIQPLFFQNGVLSAFPYMVLWVFSLTYVAIIELILTRVRVPVLVIRRISMAIGW